MLLMERPGLPVKLYREILRSELACYRTCDNCYKTSGRRCLLPYMSLLVADTVEKVEI